MTPAPIILVPGFWLGAWAWDDVAALLRADGHTVTALTLPGLESPDADRAAVTFADHVDAIAAAVEEHGGKVTFPKAAIPSVGSLIRFLDTEGNDVGAMQYDTPPHT